MENKFAIKNSDKLAFPATWEDYYETHGPHDAQEDTHFPYYCTDKDTIFRTSTNYIKATFDSKLLRILYGL